MPPIPEQARLFRLILSPKQRAVRLSTKSFSRVIGREFMPLIWAYLHVRTILRMLDQKLFSVVKGHDEG